MSHRTIYILCNPLESAQEQMAILKAFPIKEEDEICFVSEYDLKSNFSVKAIKIKRLFSHVPVLRGLFFPLILRNKIAQDSKRPVFFIHDEIFSTTMIHAIFAKLFLKCHVIVLCMENVRFSWVHRLAGILFARFVDCALCPNKEAIEYVRSLHVRHVYFCALPVLDSEKVTRTTSEIKRIGFVGRLVPQKGLRYFCESAKELPDCEFKVFGRGKLESTLREYPVIYRGTYHYSAQDLDRVFSEIDLLVLPSITTKTWSEQFGRVLAEAMDRGVLVIGSNSGAIPQVIGCDELIFTEGSAQAITEKINQLKRKTREELLQLSKTLKDRFEQNYSRRVIQKRIEEGIASSTII